MGEAHGEKRLLDKAVPFLWLSGFGQIHLLVARRQGSRASSDHSLFLSRENPETPLTYLEPVP